MAGSAGPGATPELLMIGPLMPLIMDTLAREFRVHRLWEARDADALLDEIGPRVRGIVTDGHLGAGRGLMERLPALEIVACFGVGVDAVDVAHAQARGVPVTNTPDVLTDDVADLAMGLLIAVARRLCAGDRFVREGAWLQGSPPLATSLARKRLGIVGLGRIGQAVARRAVAAGMTVSYHGPKPRPDQPFPYHDDPVGLARASDVLVLTCPGGTATRHLVDARVLEALGPEGILINVARGSVVDEAALVEALVAGRLGGAGLDVFEDEPRVPEPLLGLANVVLQPHMGSATRETRRAMGMLVIDNLRAHFAGRPLLTPFA